MLHSRESSGCLNALVISLIIGASLGCGGDSQELSLVAPAYAQSATATLNVMVVDPNGDAIPGAQITVTNVSTGSRREAVTNNDGQAGITQLAPGQYRIAASTQGFEAAEIENAVLNVGDQLAVRIPLKIAQIKTSVTVSAIASAYSESSSVSTLVDHQFIESLPLNGRSFNALIELTPGTVLTGATYSEPGQYSVNGQRQNANYYMVDGVSANVGISGGPPLNETANGSIPAFTTFGGTNGMVSEDAMQEFRIQTSSYAPEFGRTPGAQVSIVTRSGTNSFHGTTFEYLRNEALDANDWFANRLGLAKAKQRQSDFGGVFGGPLRRNRTFFFFSYEGLRLLLPQAFDGVVPSLSARQSAIPSIQPLVNAFPLPNGMDSGGGLAQFKATYSNPQTLNATGIRIDHVLIRKVNLFGRFNYAPSDYSMRGAWVPGSASQISRVSSSPLTLTVGAQMTTPRLANDLRVNYSRVRSAIEYLMDDFGGAVPLSTASIGPASATAQNSLFLVQLDDQASLYLGSQANNYQRQINVVDKVAAFRGSHQLTFGIDYRRLMPISGVHEYDSYSYFSDINKMILGQALGVKITANFGRMYPVFTNFSAYAQDTWRTNRRLTLTYGLRWELNPPPYEARGNNPFTVQGLDQPATATLALRGTPLWQTTYGNFAPRVGVAWLLNSRTGREAVLRGGFGLFYDMGNGPGAQAIFGANYPNSATKVLSNVQFPLIQSQLAPPAFSPAPPFTLYIADPHLVLPRTYQWNVGVEQSLGHTQTFSISYVGAAGRRLLRMEWVSPNALVPDVWVTRNAATSDYHALQAQFQRRLSRGLQAMASYTWSHSIDNVSTESKLNTPAASLDPRMDRGPSDFDVRHSLAAAATYDLPNPWANRLFRAVLGHWSLDSIARARSATPVNVIVRPTLGPLFGVDLVRRPNLMPGVPLYIYDPASPGGKRINPAAFADAASGQQGSLGRNALRGFPVSQLDFAVRRRFALREPFHLQLRAEFFNIFNHPNFAIVGLAARFGRPEFGRANWMLNKALGSDGTGLNQRYQLGGPRSIQLAAKLQF